MEAEHPPPPQCAIILEEEGELTLVEISRACAVDVDCIVGLVDEGVIVPRGREPQRWRFGGAHLRRARIAVHLQRDLGVNPAGAALALQLIDELDALRGRLRAIAGG